ncbi:hypothetical protein P9B03_18135 [Metasolibacillus meyeri]|uniref:DUF1189 domain-containing protein n=1 Tax=Metasolibacillus meyeri TaxID=1071052 RepID=A0AAW9NWM9_9BACL|nr:hypothetical protein [Metasolibacillus meyeri]MEC1180419.1 hypothetical protein [Metasolibacillus meyeri]
MNRLEQQLQQLYHLPKNEQLKAQIKQSLAQQPMKKTFQWKIPATIVAVCSIFILLILTNPERSLQSADTNAATLYTYFDGEEGAFKAKASSLFYTSIQKWQSEEFIHYFQNIKTLPLVKDGQLGRHIVDVIFIDNGEQRKFQLSNLDIYDVDQNIYYRDDNVARHLMIFMNLSQSKKLNFLFIICLFAIFAINILSTRYYKRLNIDTRDIFPKTASFYIHSMAILSVFLLFAFWVFFIGPVYVPPFAACFILSAYLQLRETKHWAPSLNILHFERRRIIVSCSLIIISLFFGF